MESIRKYYKPTQPTVSEIHGEIIYQEVQPAKKIENLIYCFWQLKTKERLKEDFKYRVVSDGCIDIFFDHKHLSESFIMGFCSKYTEFPIGEEFDYIGVRFLPAAFPVLFGIDAKSLSNQSQELKNVLPTFSSWISTEIDSENTFIDIVKLLSEKLIDEIQHQKIEIDKRFLNSLTLIFLNHGFLDTEKDLNTGLSPRQLRRIFNFYIGTTAKSFCNVVRFQRILTLKPSKQSLKSNKLYFEVGFFDQAHFIKSFKTYYGVTPTEAFR